MWERGDDLSPAGGVWALSMLPEKASGVVGHRAADHSLCMYTLIRLNMFNVEYIRDKDAVREYEEYFCGIVRERVQVVEACVREVGLSMGRLLDRDGFTEIVRHMLGGEEGVRTPTEEEVQKILSTAPPWFNRSMIGEDLSYRAKSIGIDIGMVLGARLIELYPGRSWRMVTKPKNDMNFGKVCSMESPIKACFEPINIGTNLVSNVVRPRPTPFTFEQFAANWELAF